MALHQEALNKGSFPVQLTISKHRGASDFVSFKLALLSLPSLVFIFHECPTRYSPFPAFGVVSFCFSFTYAIER